MKPVELLSIIGSIFATGVALAGVMIVGNANLHTAPTSSGNVEGNGFSSPASNAIAEPPAPPPAAGPRAAGASRSWEHGRPARKWAAAAP